MGGVALRNTVFPSPFLLSFSRLGTTLRPGGQQVSHVLGQGWTKVAVVRLEWHNSWGQEGPAGHEVLACECQAWAHE